MPPLSREQQRRVDLALWHFGGLAVMLWQRWFVACQALFIIFWMTYVHNRSPATAALSAHGPLNDPTPAVRIHAGSAQRSAAAYHTQEGSIPKVTQRMGWKPEQISINSRTFDFPAVPAANFTHSVVAPVHADGLNYLLMYNVCVMVRPRKLPRLVMYGADASSSLHHERRHGFFYGEMTEWEDRPGATVPQREVHGFQWHHGVTLGFRAPWRQHIGHFWDATGGLWFTVLHSQLFPWLRSVSRVLALGYRHGEHGYTTSLLDCLVDALTRSAALPARPAILSETELSVVSPQIHCFEQLALAGMMATAAPYFVGGVFSSVRDAEAVRHEVYSSLSVPEPVRARYAPIRLLFIDRCGGGASKRCITNHNALVAAVLASAAHLGMQSEHSMFDVVHWPAAMGVSDAVAASAQLHVLTLAQQAALFRGADVVIGFHGAGLTNVVLMETDSVVVEVKPLALYEAVFAAFAASAGVVHLEVPALHPVDCAVPLEAACFESPLDIASYVDGNFKACSQAPKQCDYTLSDAEIQDVTRRVHAAAQHILTRKRPHWGSHPLR